MMMGITDIDDKIIKRAAECKEDPRRLADHYEEEFFEDMANLNIMLPTLVTKVTNFVPEIINFIQRIIDQGQAYSTKDGKFSDCTPSVRCVNVREVYVCFTHMCSIHVFHVSHVDMVGISAAPMLEEGLKTQNKQGSCIAEVKYENSVYYVSVCKCFM
jgi:hypothetical protein